MVCFAIVSGLFTLCAAKQFDHCEADPMQLSIAKARQWLIHGTSDDDVPPSFSRDYVALKQRRSGKEEEDVHLLEIPTATHLDLIDPSSKAWNSVERIVLEATA